MRIAANTTALAVLLMTTAGLAAEMSDLRACRAVADDAARLKCFDTVTAEPEQTPQEAAVSTDTYVRFAERGSNDLPSSLSRRWELAPEDKMGVFNIRAYKPTYALVARYSGNPNQRPHTPSPGHQVGSSLNLDHIESKFQLSFKTKVGENLIGNNGDLWFGYTQQSSWQVYNSVNSAPFRETNYQPEVFLTLRTHARLLGFTWRLLNLGVEHQSNGRELPLSRSWNRVYAQFGFNRGNLDLFFRPWLRIDEPASTDDNPDIEDFMGRSEWLAVYHRGAHEFSALARYSSHGNRGTVQLDWHFPLYGSLRGYLQVFSGYGETLVDYNVHQNTIGLGVSLTQWQ